MTKETQRKLVRERLDVLDKAYRAEASKKIEEILTETSEWKKARKVFLYSSMSSEADTGGLIKNALGSRKRVFLPKVISAKDMIFAEYDGISPMNTGSFGISEPVTRDDEDIEVRPDIFVVPCVAVDKEGNRIGHGKGYYDRYLEKYKEVLKICIAFDAQILESISAQPTDVRMDMVLTETGFIRI